MVFDNYEFTLLSDSEEDFKKAIDILMQGGNQKALSYKVNSSGAIKVYSGGGDSRVFLPTGLTPYLTYLLFWEQFQEVDLNQATAPNIDGDCKKGFLITKKGGDEWDLLFTITPQWCIYHK